MNVAELPEELELIGGASDPANLAHYLLDAVRGSREEFVYCDRVLDGPCSIRVLTQKKISEAPWQRAPLFRKMAARELAVDFFLPHRLLQSRFPTKNDGAVGRVEKGWAVKRGEVNGHVIVVVSATWMPAV